MIPDFSKMNGWQLGMIIFLSIAFISLVCVWSLFFFSIMRGEYTIRFEMNDNMREAVKIIAPAETDELINSCKFGCAIALNQSFPGIDSDCSKRCEVTLQ